MKVAALAAILLSKRQQTGMDRFWAIRAFEAVVSAGSYSGAGRRLGVSRSHLSKTVKALEDELGAQLLHRTTKQLRTTEMGRSYYETCARILGELEEAESALGVMQQEVRGLLRVLAPKTFAASALVPAVHDFNRAHPELEVAIYLIDQMLDPIEHGFDLAIRFGEQRDSALIGRRFCVLERIACATPAYLSRHGAPARPEDLRDHECLRHINMFKDSRWVFEGPNGAVSVPVWGRMSANSSGLLREAILAGYGIGIVPRYTVAAELASGALAQVLPGWSLPPQAMHVVYPPGRPPTTKVRLFVDFLVARYADPI
jgi:DNA-binding transcriptional LysR family regulator